MYLNRCAYRTRFECPFRVKAQPDGSGRYIIFYDGKDHQHEEENHSKGLPLDLKLRLFKVLDTNPTIKPKEASFQVLCWGERLVMLGGAIYFYSNFL